MSELFAVGMRPAWALVCPLSAAILVLCFGKRPNIRECWTLLGSISLCVVVLSMPAPVLQHGPIQLSVLNLLPGIDLAFSVDAMGLVFATTSACLWILVSIYAIGYMRTLKEHAQTRFYLSFALAIFAAMGIAMAANLVTLFLFYEILTLSTYPLVAHDETPEAIAAGHKYLAYLLGGGMFFLLGILITYALAGTTEFNPGGVFPPALVAESKVMLQVVFFLFLVGFAKAAWMPVHAWLPAAMVAPTPVSALLHAVAVVKAGVFGIMRIVCHTYGIELSQALGIGVALAGIAAFSLIAANIYAIGQNNLKRMLAYSTINQLAFILLGIGMLSPMAIKGALLHIPFHGFMKITLFLCAGAIAALSKKKDITDMAGLGRRMPITFFAFAVGALGMCGAPPLAGFLSKWHVALGAMDAGMPFFLGIVLAGSLLDVVYFFPVIRTAFFGQQPPKASISHAGHAKVDGNGNMKPILERRHPLGLFMVLPLAVTALFSVLFCIFPNLFHIYDLAHAAVDRLFGGP